MPATPVPGHRRSDRRALVVVHSYYVRDTRPRRHAAALAEAGWRVDVICAREEGESRRQQYGTVRVRRLPSRRNRGSKVRYLFEYASFTLMAFGAVTAAFARHRYDVVYVIGIPNALVFSALIPRFFGARVVLDMRDPMPEFFQGKYGSDHPAMRVLRAEERVSARFATHILTVHHSMATVYRARGVPAAKITIVRYAPDPRLFVETPGSSPVRDPDDRTMLYAGTVASRYGVDLAVRAVARLRDVVPALRLRIVGDGDILDQLKDLARAEGIADRVTFDTPIPLDQIPAVVRSAWLGVQPNRSDPLMAFSLSNKVIEWARLGLPVACGVTPPLHEAFADDTLLFHEPGDLDGLCARITQADADPSALAARAARAATAAEQFRYEDEMKILLDLFARLARDRVSSNQVR